jgi:hypothetical protein
MDTFLQYVNNENTGDKFKMTQKKLGYPLPIVIWG